MRDDDQHTADQWHHHIKAIELIRAAFLDGKISADAKRAAIADENAAYYGTGKIPRELTKARV